MARDKDVVVWVCGARKYYDFAKMCAVLGTMHHEVGISVVMHGGGWGAERLASKWARANDVVEVAVMANFKRHGRRAEIMRDKTAISLNPDMVLIFPGADHSGMVRKATEAGVAVINIT